MINSAALILLTVSLHILLNREFSRRLDIKRDKYYRLKQEYGDLKNENVSLTVENSILERSARETVQLYDMTKDICKSLDEEVMFAAFRDSLSKYIKAGDCKFVKPKEAMPATAGYTVLPLLIKKNNIGSILIKDVLDEDKEKLHILAQQFLLGLKRALFYKKIQELTITDSLTQVFNRRYFLLRFSEELERSQRFNYNLSFLMIDIDRFKDYNDRYGHLVGDVILKEVARAVKENMRQIDFMGRYGGEELSVVLAETDKEQARFAAERFRQAVEKKKIKAYDEEIMVTISAGVGVFPADAKDAKGLIEKADQALYRAKASGRNRVCI